MNDLNSMINSIPAGCAYAQKDNCQNWQRVTYNGGESLNLAVEWPSSIDLSNVKDLNYAIKKNDHDFKNLLLALTPCGHLCAIGQRYGCNPHVSLSSDYKDGKATSFFITPEINSTREEMGFLYALLGRRAAFTETFKRSLLETWANNQTDGLSIGVGEPIRTTLVA